MIDIQQGTEYVSIRSTKLSRGDVTCMKLFIPSAKWRFRLSNYVTQGINENDEMSGSKTDVYDTQDNTAKYDERAPQGRVFGTLFQ